MKKILVALKEDVEHRRLLATLGELVATEPSHIDLVSLVNVTSGDDQRERRIATERSLEAIADALRAKGHEVEVHVSFATLTAGNHIVEIANKRGAELIVIGLAKRTRVGKALLGSDAQSIIMHAACPVLSVRVDG